jgi:hypothetical protein
MPQGSPRKPTPTAAEDKGRKTVKMPAFWAGTRCMPFIQSQTVIMLAARA